MKKIALSLFLLAGSAYAASNMALLMSNRSNEFFLVLEGAFVAKAKELGHATDVYDAANDATKQPGQVEDAIVKKSGAIVINPLNKDASADVLNDAVKAGIPVLAVDTTVDGVDFLAQIATDNEDGGKFAAEWIVKKSGLEAKDIEGIIHMKGIDGHSAHIDRYKGFHEFLLKDASWSAVVKDANRYIELTGNFAQDEAQNALEAKLSALKPGKKYIIYNENDVMAVGSIGAITNDSRFNIKDFVVIGFDGSSEGKKLVDEGKMAITVVQDFAFIGSHAAELAALYLKDKSKPKSSKIPIEVIMYPEAQNPRK